MMDTYTKGSDGLPTITKTTVGALDYSFDWSLWLGAVDDEIASFEVTAQNGLTVTGATQEQGIVTAWVSGGAHGQSYLVTCKITTASTPPRIDSRAIRIQAIFAK